MFDRPLGDVEAAVTRGATLKQNNWRNVPQLSQAFKRASATALNDW